MGKLLKPEFLQAASNVGGGGSKVVLRFSQDVTETLAFGEDSDLKVTATKNGVTTTTEYHGVDMVVVDADANTDIVVTGDFKGAWYGAVTYEDMPYCTYCSVDCTGLQLLAVAFLYTDVQLTHTEDLLAAQLATGSSTLDTSKLTNLVDFLLSGENLTALDVSPLASLESLGLSGCGVTSLDISHNTALTRIEIESCDSLESLTVGTLPNLTTLWIEDCAACAVPDTSGCPQLAQYYFRNSGAPVTIDTGGLTALEDVDFQDNPTLASVDFSTNTALKSVGIDSSSVVTLDLSHNPDITHVYVVNCAALETLDLSACTQLSWIGWYGVDSDSNPYPVLPAIKVMKIAHIDGSSCVINILYNTPVTDGTIYLDPNDPLYNNVKTVAENKGWNVESL